LWALITHEPTKILAPSSQLKTSCSERGKPGGRFLTVTSKCDKFEQLQREMQNQHQAVVTKKKSTPCRDPLRNVGGELL
jgi:hypothetical protein